MLDEAWHCIFAVTCPPLVAELESVDALTSCAVPCSEVAALAHESRDDAMERAALVVKRLATLAFALLPGAERAEVLGGLGNDICEKLEDDPSGLLSADRHVEKHPGIIFRRGVGERDLGELGGVPTV